MAWDFETDPEFQAKLDWMDSFVAEKVEPLGYLGIHPYDVKNERRNALVQPLQQEVRDQGLWACHLGPELGGQGYGQVKLGLMHEILGQTAYGPSIFGNNAPDSGNAELIAVGGTDDQKARWMQPLLDGKYRSCFSMTEPGAGADPTLLSTTAVRDGISGLLVDGHRPDDYAAAIRSVLDRRPLMSAGARRHAAHFSWDRTAESLVAAYTAAADEMTARSAWAARQPILGPLRAVPGAQVAQ